MLLCHGRVGTASLLESLQQIDEIFVPSYWHSDGVIHTGNLSQLQRTDTRLSEQSTLPTALDDISLGLINHNFPIEFHNAEKICNNLMNILDEDAHIFIWTRNPIDNILSSYKTYLSTYFIFELFEGTKNANGIYAAFNAETPLSLLEFIDKYSYIVDYERQKSLYTAAGYTVHLRQYERLNNDIEGEIYAILEQCKISFSKNNVKQISYPRGDQWAPQVSYAFRNRFIIDGLPLNVGYFNPTRNFPNQGTLTLEIQKNIFVAPDQWFRIPRPYKKRIQEMNDPWQIIKKTKEGYEEFEKKLDELVKASLSDSNDEILKTIARKQLIEKSIKIDFN